MSGRGPSDGGRIALVAGVVVSVLLHAGVAVTLGGVASGTARGIEPLDAPPEPQPEDETEPVRAGMDIPENASIAWLGVLEDPEEAEAPESEVDQAALTPQVGEEARPEAPAMPVEPMPQVEPLPEVQPDPEPLAPEPEPAPVVEPQPEPAPVVEPEPAMELPVEPEPQPEPAQPFPVPLDETAPVVAPALQTPEPVEIMGPPASAAPTEPPMPDQPPPSQTPSPAQPASPAAPGQSPSPAGAPGIQDERASDAAMRRSARELSIDRLGRPLQASGEIQMTTVRPTWSLQVRNAYNPRRNPFVEIRFGADGRVKLARFVAMPDGSAGSGYEEVDQPLLNAVYRWTAKGKAIDAIDRNDPAAYHAVVMRFLLVSDPPGDAATP